MSDFSPNPNGELPVSAPQRFGFEALTVLWRGDREIAVFKPAGLSSERPLQGASADDDSGHRATRAQLAASAGGMSEFSARDCVLERAKLQFYWPEARLPHRLDRPTSGILMIAADALRAADHAQEIRERNWTKYYLARVEARATAGEAAGLVGRHKAYIRREGRLAHCVRSGGDPASLEVLSVSLAEDTPRHAHLLIRLETGRFHQIRVMMANLGFPLVGDVDYGGRAWRSKFDEGRPSTPRESARDHASRLPQNAPRASQRNTHHDSRGMQLIAAGLRIDRPTGVTIIEAFAESGLTPDVSPTILQKLKEALWVAAT